VAARLVRLITTVRASSGGRSADDTSAIPQSPVLPYADAEVVAGRNVSNPPKVRTSRHAPTALAALVVATTALAGLAACTSGAPAAVESTQLSNGQFRTPTATPSPSVRASRSATPGSALLKAAAAQGCTPAEFVHYAGLAGGAVRRYVAEPRAAGRFVPGTAGRSTAVTRAGAAVAFARVQLSRAKAALKGCPTSTDRLESVIDQDRELLGLFAKEIRSGRVADRRATAAVAMHENVVAQASLVTMAVTDVVPTPAQLGS
jgi:hypothetical protein